MYYSIEPAYTVYSELSRLLIKAGTCPENKWFFTSGCFIPDQELQKCPNTCDAENFVIIINKKIIAYFSGPWNKMLNVISGFRFILFDKTKAKTAVTAFFQYLDYLFFSRGANSFQWIVAEKNIHAYKLYEKFVMNYCGHKIGKRHYGQMAYDGEISDVFLYELTKEEYFKWKNKLALVNEN